MRIFYAVSPSPNSVTLADSKVWKNNLYAALEDLGADLVDFDYDLVPHARYTSPEVPEHAEFIDKNKPRLERELLEQVRRAHEKKPVDALFAYFQNTFARPEVIKEIRDLGIMAVNWFCNTSFQFHKVAEIAPVFDFCLAPEKFRMDDYRSVGANPLYMQEAANPRVYKPYPLPHEFDATFVGQKYGNREAYMLRLHNEGVDVRACGPGWIPHNVERSFPGRVLQAARDGNFFRAVKARFSDRAAKKGVQKAERLPREKRGLPLSDEDLVKMYSRSRVSLGFSTCGETHDSDEPILQIRLRDFEAPMSGAFYMVEYMEDLEEFFDVEKEIVCYRGEDDFADKVKYYLAHPEEREAIRRAGYLRSLADHTWQKRLYNTFDKMGLKFPQKPPTFEPVKLTR